MSNNKTLIKRCQLPPPPQPAQIYGREGGLLRNWIGQMEETECVDYSILSGLSLRKRLGTVHTLPEQTAFVVGLI